MTATQGGFAYAFRTGGRHRRAQPRRRAHCGHRCQVQTVGTPQPDRPDGVDRADLYQLTSYLSRYDPEGNATGALLYPQGLRDPDGATARAQVHGPWSIEGRWRVVFETVPVTREQATPAIRGIARWPAPGLATVLEPEPS